MTGAEKIEIRLIEAGEEASVASIHLASRAATMPYLPPSQHNPDEVAEWIEHELLKRCRTWVAVRDAAILGYAAVQGDVLEHLYLRPDVRRQGIGTLLLEEVKRHSAGGLLLHVFQQNIDARAFYGRHGFTVVEIGDGSGNMENLPDLLLRWTPTP